MNLKEKMSKQNNSVKMLLKKLKHHDTFVVAIAVAIALVLCGGLIYLSTPVVTATAKEELQQSQLADSKATGERLDELQGYLSEIDSLISENQDSLASYYENLEKEKTDTIKDSEKITENVTEKVKVINNDLSALKDLVNSTKDQIDKLKESVNKGDADTAKAVERSLSEITKELERIEKEYGETKNNTTNLIAELKKTITNNNDGVSESLEKSYSELIARLSEVESNLNKINADSMVGYKDELNRLSSSLDNRLNAIDTDISDVNGRLLKTENSMGGKIDNVSDNLDQYNRNLNSMFENLGLGVDENSEDLKGYLGSELSSLGEKVEKVFWRVSNGKKMLASALLTKGIEIDEDATFEELSNAVKEIKTEYVIDLEDAGMNIRYEYHYHKDGTGKECDETYVSTDRKGGCYTGEVVHNHSDDCYQNVTTYTYTTGKDVEKGGSEGTDSDGKYLNHYYCPYCKKEFVSNSSSHTEITNKLSVVTSRGGKIQKTKTQKKLVCGHGDGEILGYKTVCGYVHGQASSAKIVFDKLGKDMDLDIDPVIPGGDPLTTTAYIEPGDDEDMVTGGENPGEGGESSLPAPESDLTGESADGSSSDEPGMGTSGNVEEGLPEAAAEDSLDTANTDDTQGGEIPSETPIS
ncbi:MAG: hypothetical protein K6G10_10690 [Butyrivibrio sp.]|nr:hypothetical protein [Butyrivibrio sp.]